MRISAHLLPDRRVDLGVTYVKYAHRSVALAKTKSALISAFVREIERKNTGAVWID